MPYGHADHGHHVAFPGCTGGAEHFDTVDEENRCDNITQRDDGIAGRSLYEFS